MTKTLFLVSNLDMGGIQRVTSTIFHGLSERGNDVYLLNTSPRCDFYKINHSNYLKPRNDLRYLAMMVQNQVKKITKTFKVNKAALYFLRKKLAMQKFDEIIVNPDFFDYFDIIRRECPDAKIYLWMHNIYDIYINQYFIDRREHLFDIARRCDGIICLEHYTRNRWRQYNKNAFIIHNPLTIIDDGVRSSLTAQTLCFTGRLVREQKGLDCLLDIASRLRDGWVINVAGDGPDRDWFVSEIQSRHLEKRIRLEGALKGDELQRHYLNSSIAIMPSRWEGFGLTAVEAMSKGLPFVGFNIPAFEEVTDGGRYGLLSPVNDIDAMVGQINKLIDNEGLLKRYASLSLARAQDFDLSKICERWEFEIID